MPSENLLSPVDHQAERNVQAREKHEEVKTTKPWRPDVFVRAYVPNAFLAVNSAPALFCDSPPVDGIDYVNYVASFGSRLFLPQIPSDFHLPPTHDHQGSRSELDQENYGLYFSNTIELDLQAQEPEVRSFDLFGVELFYIGAPEVGIVGLPVPGLREETPRVAYGDTVLLRQLIIDPRTKLPYSPSDAPAASHTAHPGFTGYQISATVIGVDRARELVKLRALGIVLSLPGSLRFNVSFIVQTQRFQCVQRAISDASRELQSVVAKKTGRQDQRSWMQCMLFPRVEDGIRREGLPRGTFTQRWVDLALNYEQKKAIAALQSQDYGTLPYLVNGPPGTGKTKTIVETVRQLVGDKTFEGSILLCAPSDQAADTLALRLRQEINPQGLFRMNEFSRTFAEVPSELLPWCFTEGEIFSIPNLHTLMKKRVIITTCRGADILVQARLTNRDIASMVRGPQTVFYPDRDMGMPTRLHYTALMVDEAAQATEPEILIPISVVTPPTTFPYFPSPIFVMAGDQHQLGPRTYDRYGTTLHISLFERLSKLPLYADHPLSRRHTLEKKSLQGTINPPFANLIRNYRSHPAILAVPSSLFYDDSLIPEASSTNDLASFVGWQGRRWPVLFDCSTGIDDCEDIKNAFGGGWYNASESETVMRHATSLLGSGAGLRQDEICIMSPFRSQVNLLRQTARRRGLWGLNIGPMESFQGLESRVVIICTTRTRARFLEQDTLRGVGMIDEPKKFNVAITRAKEGLIVIGNPWVLASDPYWVSFMAFCWRNGLWSASKGNSGSVSQGSGETNSDEWTPSSEQRQRTTLFERALMHREVEQHHGSDAVKRFMGTHQDDEMWLDGIAAEEAIAEEGYDNPERESGIAEFSKSDFEDRI